MSTFVRIDIKYKYMEITLSLSQKAVLNEVAQTTGYTGNKMTSDPEAYERISTVDEDETELKRFWNESRAELAKEFIRILCSEGMAADGDTYEIKLNVSVSFDTALLPSMQLGLFSYFVQRITSKWYVFTNKGEAADYATIGTAILNEIKEKAFYKKKPSRPTYD